MTAYPKKLRVVKNWPGGPKLNAEYHLCYHTDAGYVCEYTDGAQLHWTDGYDDLKDFTEPVEEEKEFWFLLPSGFVESSLDYPELEVPNYLRFSTKEDAENFRKWMESTYDNECVVLSANSEAQHALMERPR